MLDLLLGVGLASAVLRGYRRGLLRGAIAVAVLIAAILIGYRTGPAGADFVETWAGLGPSPARLVASAAVFLAVLVAGSFIARSAVGMLGPLRPLDRIAGALLAAAWFAVLSAMALLLVGAAPGLPGRVESLVSESRAARLVTSQSSTVTPMVSRLLGDRLIESALNINRLVGRSQVVIEGTDSVSIPPVESLELAERPGSARELFEKLNRARVEEGIGPVAWSAGLAGVAALHGWEMYESGYFSHASPVTGSVGGRLEAEGIPFRVVGENLALSPTVESVHEGLLASPSHRATMLDPRFTRVGVSALEGPFGLMVVQVFSG